MSISLSLCVYLALTYTQVLSPSQMLFMLPHWRLCPQQKHVSFPLDLDLACDLSLICGLLCLLLPLPNWCTTFASNWGRTPLSFFLVSSFKILVFTTSKDKFSSWHEVLRDTTRFSQLSGSIHSSSKAYIASSNGNLGCCGWFDGSPFWNKRSNGKHTLKNWWNVTQTWMQPRLTLSFSC